MWTRALALLPAILLTLFGFWCGTFPGAASFPAGPAGQLAVLLVAALGARNGSDPLALGPRGRLLTIGLVLAVVASIAASPVPRAGRTAALLLPAFLLLVPALAAAFREPGARRIAVAAWGVAVGAVALVALGTEIATRGGRAAMPLGHHNLLAAFLLIALPVAALGWRERGAPRWIAATAALAAAAAVVATRSLTGGAVLAALALLAAWRRPPLRRLLAGGALLAIAWQLPRAEAVLAGRDPSAAARAGYLRAGFAGIAERPGLGWGPGATPWTIGLHLRPVPGVHPPGEGVGEIHSLPIQLAYELGIGTALVTGAILLLFGLRRARTATDPGLAQAGLAGLAAGVLLSTNAAFLAVPAIPVAMAATAAAALGACPRPAPGIRGYPAWVYLAAAALALAPAALAQRAYGEADTTGSRREAAAALDAAIAWDGGFPMYRARRAWIGAEPAEERLREAVAAAEAAPGVAALWLRAGVLALEAGDLERADAILARAMATDPLSGAAPFLRFVASGGQAIDCAARALAAEPRLAAAVAWRKRVAERAAALDRLEHWTGLPPGWTAAFLERARAAPPGEGEEVDLAVQLDANPALAVSLHQFRRPPWLADLARIRLDREAARALGRIGSAATNAETDPRAFPAERCAP